MPLQQCSCKLRWLSLKSGWQCLTCQSTISHPLPSEPWVTALHMVAYMKALQWDWNTSPYASVHISQKKKTKKLTLTSDTPIPPTPDGGKPGFDLQLNFQLNVQGVSRPLYSTWFIANNGKSLTFALFMLHVQQRPIELLVTMDSDTLKVLWVSNALK